MLRIEQSLGIVVAAFLCFAGAALVDDPKDLCSLKDPKVNDCLKKALTRVLPSLVKGVPKYGIFTIDPLRISVLDLSHAPGQTLDVRHKFTDVDLSGLGSATFVGTNINYDNVTLDIIAHLKEPVRLKGQYVSVGKVLTLPINGAGPFTLSLENMKAVLKFRGHKEKKKGKIYIKMDEVRFPFTVTRMTLDFKDLFKGNQQISDTINVALNENWSAVLDDMKPSFEDAIGQAFREIANRALAKIPLQDLVRDV